MARIHLDSKRKRILAFWFAYNKENKCWPTYKVAEKALDIKVYTIFYCIKDLIEKEWMEKMEGHKFTSVKLTDWGMNRLVHSERVALGLEKPRDQREIKSVMFKNLARKKSNEKG